MRSALMLHLEFAKLRMVTIALLTVSFLVVMTPPLLMAQSAGTGALTGTVTDPTGAVVPNVTVTASNVATGQVRAVTTGADGVYRFSLLPPGSYKVKFTAAGFKAVEVPAVTVAVTETPVLNWKLEVGVTGETIEVSAAGETIDTATSTLGTLVGTQAITSLPLTSRNYTQIVSLSAGVAASVNNATVLGKGTAIDMSVNGNTPGQNNYQMDGVAINSLSTIRNGSDEGMYGGIAIPSPDAIQEFKIQTSTYDATYGRNPGANVNVVTKSGTNQIHGTAFEFIRNSALNANDFFYNHDNPDATKRKQVLNQNQFGGVIGGPIKKDKLFFFGSYQGTRQKNEVDSKGHINFWAPPIPGGDRTAPGYAAALGSAMCGFPTFIPGMGANVACDGSNINPVALKILQLKDKNGNYLIPGSGTAGYRNVYIADPARYTGDQVLLSSDYLVNQKHTLVTKYIYSRDPQTVPVGNTFNTMPGESQVMKYTNSDAILKFTSLLSNTFTNEARASFQYYMTDWTSETPITPAELGMTPMYPEMKYPPQTSILGGGTPTFGGNSIFGGWEPVHATTAQYQLGDQIAWSHGKHTIRAGGELEKVQYNYVYNGLARGWLFFGTFNDLLVGGPGNILMGTNNINGGPHGPVHGFRTTNSSLFVQDDWKVSSRLTLNVGLRWEYFGMLTDKYGNATNLSPALLASVPTPPDHPTTSGAGLLGYLVPSNYTTKYGSPALPDGVTKADNTQSIGNHVPYSNFAPRFGLAWQPTSKGNLVVRGGAGIFYDRVGIDLLVHGFTSGAPYGAVNDYQPGNPYTLQQPFPNINPGSFPSRWFNPVCAQIPAPPAVPMCGLPIFNSNLSSNFLDPNVRTPLIRQYNLNVQYEFASKWILEVGYVGSSGINLTDTHRNLNTAQVASPTHPINGLTTNTLGNVSARVPYLGYQPEGLQGTMFDAISNYNSFQATVKKQFSHGFGMQAAYTWSKALTDLIPDANASFYYAANSNNSNDFDQQYGRSAFNHPQRLIVNYHYELPFGKHEGLAGKFLQGWSIAGVTTIQNGTALTVLDRSAGSIYGTSTNARAQLCPGITSSSMLSHGSIQQRLGNYFAPNAFCPAPSLSDDPIEHALGMGTGFGNSSVGMILGPGQFNTDASLTKETKITERQSVQFRAEFYNLFNHPQFGNPNTSIAWDMSDPLVPKAIVGQISSTSVNPRVIQFGLKYIF